VHSVLDGTSTRPYIRQTELQGTPMPQANATAHQSASAPRTLGLSWPLIVGVGVLITVLVGLSGSVLLRDPDVYWHLAAGRWILDNRMLPSSDPFSHSMPGAAWTVQAWLSEVIFALLHRAGGWPALVALVGACYAATLAIMTRFLMNRMEPIHAIGLMFVCGLMLASHLSVRPHVLTWPLFALWACAQLSSSESRRSPPWWSLGVMWLWANLHGGFTLGLAVAVALAADAVVNQVPQQRWRSARLWLLFIVLAVVVSMLTPLGWYGIWYTVDAMKLDFAHSVIQEWHSPNFHKPQPVELWLLLVLGAAMVGLVKLPPVRALLVLGLLHLALVSGRSVSMLGLLSPLIMAAPLARHWAAARGQAPDNSAELLDRWFRALAAPASRQTSAISLAVAFALSITVVSTRNPSPADTITPNAAFAAAKAAGVVGRVFNDYNFGGFLIFQGEKVMIDGRADMYGDAFLKRYVQARVPTDAKALPLLLDEYKVAWTLLPPDTPAVATLDITPGWKRLFADKTAVVHVRAPSPPTR
jgi:hypothetical protein